MVNLSIFDHLGPLFGQSGPFWTNSDKNDFFASNGQSWVWWRCFGAKNQFDPILIQMGYYAVVYSLNYSIMSFSSINGTLGKNQFLFEMVQRGWDGPKRVPNV